MASHQPALHLPEKMDSAMPPAAALGAFRNSVETRLQASASASSQQHQTNAHTERHDCKRLHEMRPSKLAIAGLASIGHGLCFPSLRLSGRVQLRAS